MEAFFKRLIDKKAKDNPYFYRDLYNLIEKQDSSGMLFFSQRGQLNPDKVIAILSLQREWIPSAGFFSLLFHVLYLLPFAERLRLVPVVDQWNGCAFSEDKPVYGTDCVFEYYFEPMGGISLNDALNSFTVTVVDYRKFNYFRRTVGGHIYYRSDDFFLNEMSSLYRKYIHLNPRTQGRLEEERRKLLSGKRTLGIHCRGTDFYCNHDGHPVSIEIDGYVSEIRKTMEKFEYEQAFLATDDERIKERIAEEFHNIIFYDDVFRSSENKSVAFLENDRVMHGYRLGYEIIRDTYTLAQCRGFIGGLSNVSAMVQIIRKANYEEEFEYKNIIDKGINHNNKIWMEQDDWKK